MMRLAADPYAFDQAGGQAASELMQWSLRQMERSRYPFAAEHVNWDLLW
jgi:hypothetical protein